MTQTTFRTESDTILNHYCFTPNGERGTVVSGALWGANGKQDLCNVIYDDNQHCTEKIETLHIAPEINPKPPKW